MYSIWLTTKNDAIDIACTVSAPKQNKTLQNSFTNGLYLTLRSPSVLWNIHYPDTSNGSRAIMQFSIISVCCNCCSSYNRLQSDTLSSVRNADHGWILFMIQNETALEVWSHFHILLAIQWKSNSAVNPFGEHTNSHLFHLKCTWQSNKPIP